MTHTHTHTKHPVAFVDTETLGLDADINPVWEVALILPDDTERVWQIYRTQREISLAHPIALEMTKFNERYKREESSSEWSFMCEFSALTQGLHLAGAVISFDEERLRRMAWQHGIEVLWHYHIIDVEALAIGHLAGLRYGEKIAPPWKSDELTAAMGITVPEESKHTALGDARWAKAIYEKVMY